MSPSIDDFTSGKKPEKGTGFVLSTKGASLLNNILQTKGHLKEGDILTYPAITNNDGNPIHRYLQMSHTATGTSLPVYRDKDLFLEMRSPASMRERK